MAISLRPSCTVCQKSTPSPTVCLPPYGPGIYGVDSRLFKSLRVVLDENGMVSSTCRYFVQHAHQLEVFNIFPTLQVNGPAICDMVHVAGFRINVFGGERFADYVSSCH